MTSSTVFDPGSNQGSQGTSETHFGVKNPLRPMIWNKNWSCQALGAINFLIMALIKEPEACKAQQEGAGVTLNNRRHTGGCLAKIKRSSCTWEKTRGGLQTSIFSCAPDLYESSQET